MILQKYQVSAVVALKELFFIFLLCANTFFPPLRTNAEVWIPLHLPCGHLAASLLLTLLQSQPSLFASCSMSCVSAILARDSRPHCRRKWATVGEKMCCLGFCLF